MALKKAGDAFTGLIVRLLVAGALVLVGAIVVAAALTFGVR